MTLEEIVRNIRPSDPKAKTAALERWNGLAKPLGSLGVLEEDIVKIAGISTNEEFLLDRRVLLVFCADNGVVARGVSQSDHTVTAAVASALGSGNSTVNYMAKSANCSVIPVDVGMRDHTPHGVLNRKVRAGTADITEQPAMTREECMEAILTGMELVRQQAAEGTDILLLGEMGIGNTTTATAVACVLTGLKPEELTGKGAGLSEAGYLRKIQAIKRAIDTNRPDPSDPLDILQKVGGLDLATLCGACLGSARYRVPVMLDGSITNAAALCAVCMCPSVRDVLLASHISREPAAKPLLEALGLEPCISAGLRLGEGSGAVLALPLLDQALAVYRSGHTFNALGIEAYTPQ